MAVVWVFARTVICVIISIYCRLRTPSQSLDSPSYTQHPTLGVIIKIGLAKLRIGVFTNAEKYVNLYNNFGGNAEMRLRHEEA